MEEMKNWTWKEVVNISEIFPWEPTFNKVIITLNTEESDGNLRLSDNTMSEKQFIVAKGSYVRNLELCDEVIIDLNKLMIMKPNPNNQHEEIGSINFNAVYDDEGNMFAEIEDKYIRARRRTDKPLQTNE